MFSKNAMCVNFDGIFRDFGEFDLVSIEINLHRAFYNKVKTRGLSFLFIDDNLFRVERAFFYLES
jgi:hypothetical protein